MIEKKIVISNPTGVDTRTAAILVQTANQFTSIPWIEKDDVVVNAKSIMGIISLALAQGDEILLKIDGPDENESAEQLTNLLK